MILYIIIGLIIGILVMIPFVVKRKKINTSIQKQIETLQQQKENLDNELFSKYQSIDEINKTIYNLNQKEDELNKKIDILYTKRKEIENSIEINQKIAKQSVDVVYQTAYERMAENISKEADRLAEKLEANRTDYENEYIEILNGFAANFLEMQRNFDEELEKRKQVLEEGYAKSEKEFDQIKQILEIERSKVEAAIEANKREEEKKNTVNKYRITLSNTDLKEIKYLKELIPHLRNSRPISKIIWESYFRTATNNLILRTVGPGSHTGIYLITNLLNGKHYVGQSVDIAERFRQHIKCGLGIDTPNNILYKAMLQDGIENFAFEVLQECDRINLNAQETYWIDFYKSQDYGYNMTKGGS